MSKLPLYDHAKPAFSLCEKKNRIMLVRCLDSMIKNHTHSSCRKVLKLKTQHTNLFSGPRVDNSMVA